MVPVTWIGGTAAVPSAAKGLGVASGAGSLIVSYLLTRRVLLAQSATPGVASAVGVGAAGLVAVAPYATGNARERECRSRMPTLEGVFFFGILPRQ